MLRKSTTNLTWTRPTTKGMTSSEITKKHAYKTWSTQRPWVPVTITGAKDSTFWDASGKKYLDFSAQLMCVSLGHNNEAVANAIIEQAKSLSYVGPIWDTPIRSQAISKLLEVAPQGIEKFFFPTSGAQANEAAIKVARHYTGKQKIITRFNAYHGASQTTLSMTSDWRRYYAEKHHFLPSDPYAIYIPEMNSYRPAEPLGYNTDNHIQYLEYLFKNDPNIAAIFMETVTGSNGVLIPPPDYYPKIRELTKKYGVLMVMDEVMAAWGRCGEWFAIDKWGVAPDIITTAKGITNSAQPLGVMGTTREIANFFEDNCFCNGHTYESHPMTLAPAVAAINEFQRLDLINKARTFGENTLGAKLKKLKDNHPSVGDVRGTGMFWAIDLTKNQKTKEPFATNVSVGHSGAPAPVAQVAAELLKLGVFVIAHINHIVIAPPLVITEEEVDFGVAALDKALKITDALVDKQ